MTSEREWGCYPEVPGLAIAQLSRVDGVAAVLVSTGTGTAPPACRSIARARRRAIRADRGNRRGSAQDNLWVSQTSD